jgi:uncharacterized repeat protein (TIGR01451 family)
LSLSEPVPPAIVTVGSNVTYTIQINNNSVPTFSGVTMTNQLPSNIQYSNAVPSRGSVVQSNGQITWTIGTMTNNSSATITITGTATNAGTVVNYSTVLATESEPNFANNTAATATTVRGIADVTVTITNVPASVFLGNNITNTITVRNKGSWTATAATMNYDFPAGTTFVSATPSSGSHSVSAGGVTYNPGTLTNGAEGTIIVVVQTSATGTVTNTATVTAFEVDPLPGNNSASATTTVTPNADVQITGSGSPSLSFPGNTLTYTLLVTNAGPSMATGVILSNTLPASVNYGSASSTLGTCTRSGQLVTCNIGTLTNTNVATITIVVTNSGAGVLTNIANLFATSADGNSANNTATIINTVSLPTLSITRSGTNVTLLWPLAATGYQLQFLTNLAQTNWSSVTNPVVTNSQYSVVTSGRSPTNRYFRLRKP